MQPPDHAETITDLKTEIADCRRQLEDLWDSKDFTDAEILAIGNKLDKLLNRYHQLNPVPKS